MDKNRTELILKDFLWRVGYSGPMKYLTTLLLTAITCTSQAAEKRNEAWYQDRHCKGKQEHVLSDRTRVDCLTRTHAIEYDWGRKWSEAIGQSLGYAFETNKRAGIVLILEDKGDYKYWLKLNSIIDHYKLPIDSWKIEDWAR